eukprot:TRINITY_DN2106_c0_g1_i2.p1 TRINITY_DN2106_c0_g1~~TRINITY_DN2106_c0_g1_i2.p1  ORF type:complete len:445 (-),score=78.31 TRINITY_DN2106_c0_g1_i2:41-1330(-)
MSEDWTKLSENDLKQKETELLKKYEEFKNRKLNLNMTRGKPAPAQLDLSKALLSLPGEGHYKASDGLDCRNYGGLDGNPECKKLFADIMGISVKEVVVGGASSLTMMHDHIVRGMLFGYCGSEPWHKYPGGVKWICPVPGYDRHFAICEKLGIQMINVSLNENGPDMEAVEKLVLDPSVKGIWCVPMYGNPNGVVYSDEVVTRLANMKVAANDFRLVWDNAYIVHHLVDNPPTQKNILDECKKAGNPDRPVIFVSTSKITFASAGVAALGASEANIQDLFKSLTKQTIGPDKINQLRHTMFFKDLDAIHAHMKKHAAILKPKFDAVLEVFERDLSSKNIAHWTKPKGGYFITLDTLDGCGKAVVDLAKNAGVELTPAGAVYPYGKDPHDRSLRIAPSFPSLEEIRLATEGLSICVQLASVRKLLKKSNL